MFSEKNWEEEIFWIPTNNKYRKNKNANSRVCFFIVTLTPFDEINNKIMFINVSFLTMEEISFFIVG